MPAADSHWVHDLDPFLIRFTDDIGIRYYGLAYICGLLIGWWLVKRMSVRGQIPLRPPQVADLATAIGIGMIVGGRLGYCLGYQPSLLWTFTDSFPFWGVLDLGSGGMASHGGIIGFICACAWFSYRHKIHFLILCDIVAVVSPLGVFFGRIANFINGELWGRTSSVPWAMIFPESIRELHAQPELLASRWQAFQQSLPQPLPFTHWSEYAAQLSVGSPAYEAFYRAMLAARHPSQLYACILEGALVFAVSYPFFTRHRRPGLSSAVVLTAYGLGRFIGEFWRQPDLGYELYFGWMSKGQLYTLPFLLFAGILYYLSLRRPTRPELYRPAPLAAA